MGYVRVKGKPQRARPPRPRPDGFRQVQPQRDGFSQVPQQTDGFSQVSASHGAPPPPPQSAIGDYLSNIIGVPESVGQVNPVDPLGLGKANWQDLAGGPLEGMGQPGQPDLSFGTPMGDIGNPEAQAGLGAQQHGLNSADVNALIFFLMHQAQNAGATPHRAPKKQSPRDGFLRVGSRGDGFSRAPATAAGFEQVG